MPTGPPANAPRGADSDRHSGARSGRHSHWSVDRTGNSSRGRAGRDHRRPHAHPAPVRLPPRLPASINSGPCGRVTRRRRGAALWVLLLAGTRKSRGSLGRFCVGATRPPPAAPARRLELTANWQGEPGTSALSWWLITYGDGVPPQGASGYRAAYRHRPVPGPDGQAAGHRFDADLDAYRDGS